MDESSDQGSKLRDVFTRQREMPESLRPLTDDMFHPISERNRRDANRAAKFGLILLAYGLALAGLGWIVFTLF
jgi:hypothetical protein